ncbi:hypothetical protein QJS04_geneDACA006958 [Acorus gramineus]|uniref:F-ATPase gamma subunit n=1 Tax=Acorus gramineus TaxID=55184 RepID=A0AAV9AVG8_ACOGR|nr:hypothetical protein QJS04_geneDACA006958 [Acorus gramineus]
MVERIWEAMQTFISEWGRHIAEALRVEFVDGFGLQEAQSYWCTLNFNRSGENRMKSVKNIQKITKAMKMVAASKLRSIQVLFSVAVENACSELGARMSAMDSSSRNAGQMPDRHTLTYNRTRQASITMELIEIISGALALTG